MKNKTAALFAVSAVLAAAPLSAQAAGTFKISADTVSVSAGEEFDYAVNIAENPGIVAVALNVEYDTDALELLGCENKKLFEGADFTASGTPDTMPFGMLWENALRPDNYTDTGELAVLRFKALDTAHTGHFDIDITITEGNVFDVNLVDVPFVIVSGGVDIGTTGAEQKPADAPKPTDAQEKAPEEKTEESGTAAPDTTSMPEKTQVNDAEDSYEPEISETADSADSSDRPAESSAEESESPAETPLNDGDEPDDPFEQRSSAPLIIAMIVIFAAGAAVVLIVLKKPKE